MRRSFSLGILFFRRILFLAATSAALMLATDAATVFAQVVVPGSGKKLSKVGDDFEDEAWGYVFNRPKSTLENDKNTRYPAGVSKNGRWYEGPKRGQPDMIKRVKTPEGGLEGSSGALLLRSCYTGIPGRPSYSMQQDDFIADVRYILGGAIPLSRSPSVVTRVYMQPFEKWERRTGPTFAIRASVEPPPQYHPRTWRNRNEPQEPDTYWPGMLVDFYPKREGGPKEDTAYFRIRANESGGDYRGPKITQTGWWTLGMSFTPDGQIHYFAKPGIEDLTAEDHIASHHAYSLRGVELNTFFFNVCSGDDGKTWSTAWIVDDPTVYIDGRRVSVARRR